ncbi:protein-tyrosine phosphatase [Lactobacillus selangorensis]|uniref:Protein-tyrosine phosphatase n=1 Tax=Lactobacillus selangorensis TaxID=81857 RepID=A0A0R2FUS5_9LACO|nr:tyrosine-protein phosphatase [Lactobacillus selangorensis]KRN28988.1 protein-tyrosine phosphatase [Lactobacillus selangorensis]KRN32602.1 protein-tyrosine phosphatase [Lactobacillus selangorensis]
MSAQEDQNRILALQKGINFRELGGYPTQDGRHLKWHKLLRSGTMNRLTQEDIDYLIDYGLRYDIDLRSEDEAQVSPDKLRNTVVYQLTPVYPFVDQTTGRRFKHRLKHLLGHAKNQPLMGDTYTQMITDSHPQETYRNLFETLLMNDEDNSSVVFHCAAGKDRTGVGAMLVLSALGVDKELIRKDYLLTNVVLGGGDKHAIKAMLTSTGNAQVDQMNAGMGVESSNFDAVFAAIEAESGTVEQYLHDKMKLSDEDLEQLKNLYLE